MKKLLKISLSLFSLLFLSCNLKDETIQSLQKDVNRLKIDVANLNKDAQNLKFKNATLLVSELGALNIFDPKDLKISLYSKRPQKNNKMYLVVPAAFTDRNNKVDGLFIEKGSTISTAINEKLNGICIISNNKLKISKHNPLIENEAITKKQSLFQQVLLIFDSKIIKCELFKSDLNLRRALVEINNRFYLVQSKNRTSIAGFQNALISIKVNNAIYLDMGTYSEGWYKNDANDIITIGETMTQTNMQSNWLAFESL